MIKGAVIFAIGGAIGFGTGWLNGLMTGFEIKTARELAKTVVESERSRTIKAEAAAEAEPATTA